MSRKNFHDLLARYLEGNCTAEEKETVEQWYKMLDNDEDSFTNADLSNVENRIWAKISGQITAKSEQPETTSVSYPFYADKRSMLTWAALLTGFVIAVGFLFFYPKQKKPDFNVAINNAEVIRNFNQSALPKKVNLQDGSYVLLKPGASITYPKQFARQKREVFLTGEAFFQISKNPDRPFLIFNNNTVTRVVGTSFTIKTDEKTHQTEVSVRTGRVIVTENDQHNFIKSVLNKPAEVVLVPNQKTIYTSKNQYFKTTLVALPVPVLEHNEQLNKADFVFNETPVATVLKSLENIYGIKINATKEVGEETFTGDVSGIELYNKLDMICQSVHATYQISGTEIYIK